MFTKLRTGLGEKPIVEIKTVSGLRIHFIEMDPIDDIPVIMRIATYYKLKQTEVFKEITSEGKGERKRARGKI